ncbi:hypothetical protein ACFPRA_21240 [Sporosarcina soli]|uniref:Lipoprotein n=1 Tax=Sporosarcina soli TaxID=334736 RepID=A0ABW0TPL1_9BACL
MKKIKLIFIAVLIFLLISGCTKPNKETATISANADSEYIHTFKDLNLGILFDFNFRLPDADKRMVTIWVEGYQDGEKEPDPLTQIAYGSSPQQVTEGHLGFGIINSTTEESILFLYAPSVSTSPVKIESLNVPNRFSAWDYAIGDEKVALSLGETKLLAVYRQSAGNAIRTYDFQDEEAVKQMIKEDSRVLLLKMKIEESHE